MTLHVELGVGAAQAGSTQAGDILRRHDWVSTPLGARETWAQSLRTTLDIMLGSGHAMCLAWGPDQTFLYNDAYAPFLGARHPRALGMRFAEVWSDIWSDIGPLVERVFAGETQTFQAMPLVMTRNGYAEDTWWDFSYSPVHDETGAVLGLLNVASEATKRILTERERDRALAELRDREAFMRSVLSASSDCIKVLDIDARLVFMSEGGRRTMEVSDFNAIAGCPWPDFWQEEGNLAARNAIAEAKAGRPATFQGYAETMKGNRRYWDVQVSPILGEDGRPERILSVSRDITALKAAEEARTVLAQEMAHRMKNSLAMVQAIATQTLRQAKSMEEGRVAISERLAALARAQDILTRSDFTEADVGEVVEATIAPHQGKAERISWSGPRVGLASQQALGLSLAIHELATNAAKYGALSNETGTIAMAWGHERGVFFFTWNEAGGPAVSEPASRGFGSRLIERIVASYFDGEACLEFAPAGVRFRLTGASDGPEKQVQGRVA